MPNANTTNSVKLPSGDLYYFRDSISGYIKSSNLVAGANITLSEDSSGNITISASGGANVVQDPVTMGLSIS